ncbi:hypothetical protein GXM_00977 [Nostoc sphaeroides CCNUC1]|uniref:Uncharacterized protein n=1 Tax=Nostoc sphaeroides CCNUC1 TaxID=2653204 RepID=A0A5P8VT50_9NOSO|nr:hypothetical protein GXM_00977 [Nostoc sphaeroides CCNUC1]
MLSGTCRIAAIASHNSYLDSATPKINIKLYSPYKQGEYIVLKLTRY